MRPLNNILAAVMRANGEVQAQSQAKKVASDQMDAPQPVVTMKANPNGGPPLVTVKDISADQLNGTQESDVEQAYAAPKANVERKIGLFETVGQYRDRNLSEAGYRFRDQNVRPEDVDSFGERYRARRELGGGIFSAAAMAGITGARKDADLVRNLANSRTQTKDAVFQQNVKPILGEMQNEAQIAGSKTGHALQANQQYLSARNQLLDQKNIMGAASEDEFMSGVSQALSSVGGMRQGDEQQFRSAWRTGRVSFLNDRRSKLAGEEGQKAIAGYGDTDTDRDRFIAEQAGVDPNTLNDREREGFNKLFVGLTDKKRKDEAKEARAIDDQRLQREAAARSERLVAEMAAGRLDQRKFNQEMKTLNATVETATKYQKEIEKYVEPEKSLATVKALAKDDTGQSDYALLLSFVHGIDNTAAREGEVAMAKDTADKLTQAKQILVGWKKGTILDPKVRAGFVRAAESMTGALRPFREKVDKRYAAVADRFQLDKTMIGLPTGKVRVYDPKSDSFVDK